MEADSSDYAPPTGPPPLLNTEQIETLARQGWLNVPLSTLSTANLTKLFNQLSAFCDLPIEQKKATYPEKLLTEFGYYHVQDEKEYVTLRCSQHPESEFEKTASQVWRDSSSLLHRALCDIARAAELPPSVWDQVLDGNLALPDKEADMTPTLLRMFRYEPNSGFAGRHVDLGLLTLCVGTKPGLQALDRDTDEETWVDAWEPTILIGKTLQVLTNGLIRPGVHKVVPNPEGRHSIVFTLRHSFRHQIDLERFGGEGSVDPKELWEQMKDGVVNINARKDFREKQAAKSKERLRKLRKQQSIDSEEESKGQG